MTTAVPLSGRLVLDLSGALSGLLNRYAQVLTEYRRQMTGDPAGLCAVAQSYRTLADQAAGVCTDLHRHRTQLAQHWSGAAYDAYGTATGRVTAGLDGSEARLRRHAAALENAAGALRSAAAGADSVLTQFQAAAQVLIAYARAVPQNQMAALVSQARQLGEQAITAIRGIYDTLAAALVRVAAELGAPSTAQATPAQVTASATQGRAAAVAVRAALAGDASPERFRQAMAELGAITERLRTSQPQSAADKAYLTAFYGELGERIFDLPGYLNADDHRYNTSLFGLFGETAPGFAAADRQAMMTTVGNGILTLSQHPTDLPPAVRDLVFSSAATETNIGTDSWGFTREVSGGANGPLTGVFGETVYTNRLDVPRFAQWEALSQLTHAADRNMVAGTEFSTAMTRRVGEIADVTQRLDDISRLKPTDPGYYVSTNDAVLWDKPRVDTTLTSMLDVSTRNHVANAALVGDAATLGHLSGFAWADDGRAAGQVIDWIGSGTADPAEHDLARGAYVDLTQTMTDPSSYERMLAGMRENPHLSEAVARATVPNLDLYAQPLDGLDTDTRADRIGGTDARHMLMLAETTQTGRDQINAGADLYKEYLLRQADAGTIPMEQAGRYAGNVDGLTNAAAANAIWHANVSDAEQATKVAQESYTRQMAIANAVKDVAGFGAGTIPQVGSFAGFAVGQAGNLITGAMQAPAPVHPVSLPTDVFHHPQFTGNGAVYTAASDLAGYELRTGGNAPDVPVGSMHGTAAEEAVRWARADAGRADYLDAYNTAAHYVYLENLATQTRESIQYDVQGRRP
ncbi:TPR repeat region-containing protein [Micromonospora sp. NPDC003197]